MEFKIPLRKEDLLNTTASEQYTVKEILTAREICDKSLEIKTSLREQGSSFILEYFDVFYSCLSEQNRLDNKIKYEFWNVLTKGFDEFLVDMKLNVEDEETLDCEMRLRLQNTLKMYIYILSQWMSLFEADAKQSDVLLTKRGKGKQSAKDKNNSKWDWNNEQAKVIDLLIQLGESSYHKLWEENKIEDEFLNLVFNCSYKILENANICRMREKKESLFHFLGTLFKYQKQSIGHAVKIVQLLQLYDHMAVPLAQGMVIYVQSYNMKQMLCDVIREIGHSSSQNESHNNIGNRAFSIFLGELAKHMPSLVLLNISYLAVHLDNDSYYMRNCVLGIMGEILLQAHINSGQEVDERVRALREQFLDHLEDHLHDVHAFVRSRCLQIWTQLCEQQAIPIARQQNLLDIVIGRLQDKSCSVRKYAIHFFTAILQSNPFAAKISLNELEESFSKEKEKFLQMGGSNELLESSNNEKEEDIEMTENVQTETDNIPTDISKQKILIHYLKDCIAFARIVEKALPQMCRLLSSNQSTDVLEAIAFFVTAHKFGVHNSIIGIQKMLTLIWTKEQEVKNAVLTAAKTLYLDKTDDEKNVVNNLIRLTLNATIGELLSLEQLIHDLVVSGDIDRPIINALWKRFRHQDKYSDIESQSAIILIGMAASASSEIIERKLDIIVDIGLGDRATKDFYYTKDVCKALLKLGSSKTSHGATDNKAPFCLPHTHTVFKRLTKIMVDGLQPVTDHSWIEMTQQAVDVIYKLSDKPDLLSEEILKSIVEQNKVNIVDDKLEDLSVPILAGLLLLSGHIALRQMLHLEVTIFNELKRRRNLKEEKLLEKVARKKNRRKSKSARESLCESAIDSSDNDGLNGAVAEDADADFIRKICDNNILTGDRVLAVFAEISLKIAGDPIKYPHNELQSASSLALTKFMAVSQTFCEDNIQLLFTILEKSKLPSVRATLMIAVGDLACRFPNVVEPWTAHIFKRVRDESFEVRENAVAIIGHLLFNDMIKVKGCVSDVALCLLDKDAQIVKKTKQLFYDLSQKPNAIFNLVPDVIGRLLDADSGTTEEGFKEIMAYLLSFVKKDRLLESMVEKICHRFSVVSLEWQWRCLAYCLTLICENEKCYRKLIENLGLLQESLAEDTVYKSFNSIVANARKTFKQELQTLIDDLENQLENNRKKALGDDYFNTKTERSVLTQKKSKPRRRTPVDIESDEETPKSDARKPNFVKVHSTRSLGSRKINHKLVFSSEEDEDF